MSVYYDTNIPSYNKFRYNVPSSVDTLNRVSIAFTNVPAELTEYILAGLATAIDVNAWRGDYADRQAIVDLFNEVVVTYDICDLVADCIANDASVQQAINDYAGANLSRMESGVASDDTAIASSSPSYNLPLLTGDCDDDVIFGQVTGIVDLANTLITDLWEKFELGTTGIERSATFASAIPAIGLLPADEIIAFADNELQNLFEGYEGAYTAQLRDQYRCDLYCIALDNECQLTVADAAEYFRKRAGADIFDGLTFSEVFTYFFTGVFGGELISHASHYLLFAVLAFSARFLNFDSFYYSTAVKSFANDPDPDWSVICDPCGTACYEWDFTQSAHSWEVWTTENRPYGTYVSGVGWRCEFVNIDGIDDNAIYIEILDFPSFITPESVQIDVIGTAGGANRSIKVRTVNGTSNNPSVEFPKYALLGNQETLSVPITDVGDGLRINVNTDIQSGLDADALTVVAIRVYYESGEPIGGADCSA